MKKVLIFGAGGMLGYAVSKYFTEKGYTTTNLTRAKFDILNHTADELADHIKSHDAVINCAGVIKPMIKENTPEATLLVNGIFPLNMANVCEEANVPCFHITTDCVYDGKAGNYDEKSFFNADDLYGMSKNAGEPTNCMVLRTSIIGEEKGQSRSLLEWARSQKGKEVNGFVNHDWNGVTTVYLAEMIDTILQKKLYNKGIFHLHSPKPVNKFELVSIFNEVYNLDLTINPTDAPVVVDRTLASVKPLSRELCVKDIPTQVREMREFFAN